MPSGAAWPRRPRRSSGTAPRWSGPHRDDIAFELDGRELSGVRLAGPAAHRDPGPQAGPARPARRRPMGGRRCCCSTTSSASSTRSAGPTWCAASAACRRPSSRPPRSTTSTRRWWPPRPPGRSSPGRLDPRRCGRDDTGVGPMRRLSDLLPDRRQPARARRGARGGPRAWQLGAARRGARARGRRRAAPARDRAPPHARRERDRSRSSAQELRLRADELLAAFAHGARRPPPAGAARRGASRRAVAGERPGAVAEAGRGRGRLGPHGSPPPAQVRPRRRADRLSDLAPTRMLVHGTDDRLQSRGPRATCTSSCSSARVRRPRPATPRRLVAETIRARVLLRRVGGHPHLPREGRPQRQPQAARQPRGQRAGRRARSASPWPSIRSNELYVATVGDVEAYLVRAARLLVPEHARGAGLPGRRRGPRRRLARRDRRRRLAAAGVPQPDRGRSARRSSRTPS